MWKNHSKSLKICSIFYFFIATLSLIFIVLLLFAAKDVKPVIEEAFENIDLKGLDPITFISIVFGVELFLYAFLGWLTIRIAKKKGKVLVLIIFLAIMIIFSITSLLSKFNVLSCMVLILHILVLYHTIEIRKEIK